MLKVPTALSCKTQEIAGGKKNDSKEKVFFAVLHNIPISSAATVPIDAS